MNRYTRRPIVIADEALASRRISGVYSTGDPEAFARSISILMPARVEFTPTQILLRAAEEN
jgi:transmembrane sensor